VNPVAFLRHVDWGNVRDVALVQTGPAHRLPQVLARLRAEFPSASIQAVVEEDGAAVLPTDGIAVAVARPGRRLDLLRELRRRRFDLVVIQFDDQPMAELGRLAFLLRARSMLAFNQNLDHFPVNVHRAATISQHFGGDGRGGSALVFLLVRRFLSATVVSPATTAWLAAKAAWRRARGPRPRAAVLAARRRGAPRG